MLQLTTASDLALIYPLTSSVKAFSISCFKNTKVEIFYIDPFENLMKINSLRKMHAEILPTIQGLLEVFCSINCQIRNFSSPLLNLSMVSFQDGLSIF
jgi:hypothetical protein